MFSTQPNKESDSKASSASNQTGSESTVEQTSKNDGSKAAAEQGAKTPTAKVSTKNVQSGARVPPNTGFSTFSKHSRKPSFDTLSMAGDDGESEPESDTESITEEERRQEEEKLRSGEPDADAKFSTAPDYILQFWETLKFEGYWYRREPFTKEEKNEYITQVNNLNVKHASMNDEIGHLPFDSFDNAKANSLRHIDKLDANASRAAWLSCFSKADQVISKFKQNLILHKLEKLGPPSDFLEKVTGKP